MTIEDRLAAIERRLDAIERRLGPQPAEAPNPACAACGKWPGQICYSSACQRGRER